MSNNVLDKNVDFPARTRLGLNETQVINDIMANTNESRSDVIRMLIEESISLRQAQ